MLSSLKESAKGSPTSRAKRARTSFRVVMGASNVVGVRFVRWGGPTAGSAAAAARGRRQATWRQRDGTAAPGAAPRASAQTKPAGAEVASPSLYAAPL